MTIGYPTDATSSPSPLLVMDEKLSQPHNIFPLEEDFVFPEPNKDHEPVLATHWQMHLCLDFRV